MNALVRNIQACFGIDEGVKYASLHKKCDDPSQDFLNRWIALYPIEDFLKNLETSAVQTYVTAIFQELKKIEIDNSNVHIIANHLYEIAKRNERIQTLFLKQVVKLNCHPQEKELLQQRLSYLVADHP